MKTDFTLGELLQIEAALTFQIQCCKDEENPLVKLFVEYLYQLRAKVSGLIRSGEVENVHNNEGG